MATSTVNTATVEQMLLDATQIEDPVDRARVLHRDVLPAADSLRRQVIRSRARSVAKAKRGHSYSALANELGCSKPLIQQLAAAGAR